MKTYAYIAGITALWVFFTPFFGFSPEVILWSNLISGAIIAITGIALVKEFPGRAWTAALLGIWLFVAATLPDLQAGIGLILNNIILGITVASVVFSALSKEKTAVKDMNMDNMHHAHQH